MLCEDGGLGVGGKRRARGHRQPDHSEVTKDVVLAHRAQRKVDGNATRGAVEQTGQPVEFQHQLDEMRINVGGWDRRMELTGAPEDDLRSPRQDRLPHLGDVVIAIALHVVVVEPSAAPLRSGVAADPLLEYITRVDRDVLVVGGPLPRLDTDAHAVELRRLPGDVVAVLAVALVPVRILDDDADLRAHLLGDVDEMAFRLLGHEPAAVVGPGIAAAARQAFRAGAGREEPVIHDDFVEHLGEHAHPALEGGHILRIVVTKRTAVGGDDGAGDLEPLGFQGGGDLAVSRDRGRFPARVLEVDLRETQRREVGEGRPAVLGRGQELIHVAAREIERRLDVLPPRARVRCVGAQQPRRERHGAAEENEGEATAHRQKETGLGRRKGGHGRRVDRGRFDRVVERRRSGGFGGV